MRAGTPAPSSASTAVTCFPTPMRESKAKIRSGSTQSYFPGTISGATTPIQPCRCRSRLSSRILSRSEVRMEHDRHDDHASELSDMQLRTRALETILLEKGYIEPAAIDVLIETYEKKIGPRNGAQVVAKAWVDSKFRQWLFEDGTAAIATLGFGGRSGNHLVALENTPAVHNMTVCTLCSCYPWAVLGLPPL